MDQFTAMSFIVLVISLISLLISVPMASASPDKRQYREGEYIPLYANKVRPLDDRCEAYPYFALPFCPPGKEITNRKKSLDEIVEGDCFSNTLYELRFKVEKVGEVLCEKRLTKYEVAKFREAIKNKYEFQMNFNNILLWGEVGKIGYAADLIPQYYLVKNLTFYAYSIKNQVKAIFLISDFHSAVDITEDVGVEVNFTYSIFWNAFDDRVTLPLILPNHSAFKYLWPSEQEPKWDFYFPFSGWAIIFFWALMIFWVTGSYLNDFFDRYSVGHIDGARGWLGSRQIHGDLCSCPQFSSLLGAIMGIGIQLLILICALFILAYNGILNPCNLDVLFHYIWPVYAVTSAVSGYIATSFHCHYTEVGWKECVFQTGFLYSVPTIITFMLVYLIATLVNKFSNIPPLASVVILSSIVGFGIICCLTLGGNMGYDCRRIPQPPCATRRIPKRVALQLPWYMETPVEIFLGGLLPFITIFWNMDNIYASLFIQQICRRFSTLLTAFTRVLIMTIIVSICSTYFHLSKHHQGWWWRSVFRGGSTAIFMFTYGIYFLARSTTFDIMIMLPIGYSFVIFYALFLALGAISFYASFLVFRIMYRGALKDE